MSCCRIGKRFVRLRWMVTVGDFAMNFEDWNEKKKLLASGDVTL